MIGFTDHQAPSGQFHFNPALYSSVIMHCFLSNDGVVGTGRRIMKDTALDQRIVSSSVDMCSETTQPENHMQTPTRGEGFRWHGEFSDLFF